MQRVTLPGALFGVLFTDPEPPALIRVIEAVGSRLQQFGQVGLAHTVEHGGGSGVGRVPDHAGQLLLGLFIQYHLPVGDALKGPPQNRNLRQAGGIEHGIAVDFGKPRMIGFGNVHQRHTHLAAFGRCVQLQLT